MNNDKNSCADRFVHHNTSRAFTTAKTSGKSGVGTLKWMTRGMFGARMQTQLVLGTMREIKWS